MKNHPPEGATERSRKLRLSMTDAERAMWALLRDSFADCRFRRQVPLRHFIADFASHRAKLVIEIDGGQHHQEVDADRTRIIEAEGYRLVRFWNHDVLGNPEGVWRVLDSVLHDHHPHPASPIEGEEKN